MGKMQEWLANNRYNSFSSEKGLTYFEQYQQIIKWMNGESAFLPPPKECNIDPYAECQLDCKFCIVQRYIKNNRAEVGEMRKLPTEYLLTLVDFLKDFGVKAGCFSGGGEPTLHDGLARVLNRCTEIGLESSLVTNMADIKVEVMDALMQSRWVAMSVDACNRDLYKQIKGRDRFFDVVSNINKLTSMKANTKSKVDIAYKMLILEENYKTIFETCKLAKELGCNTFHVRPVDLERADINGHKKQVFDMDIIKEQFDKCHEIESPEFSCYTITHKFDSNFHVTQNFNRCLATPMLMTVLTDGNSYVCVDKKMEKNWMIGSSFPNPEDIAKWWGSNEHRERLKRIDVKRDCSGQRCTFCKYNEQAENIVLEDKLYRNFP
jgi:cyclic pyranopterin phosphate synthase